MPISSFSSGAYLSLLSNPLMEMGNSMNDIGTRIGMFMTIMAMGALVGPPISGVIANTTEGSFKLVGYYAGTCILAGVGLMCVTRNLVSRAIVQKDWSMSVSFAWCRASTRWPRTENWVLNVDRWPITLVGSVHISNLLSLVSFLSYRRRLKLTWAKFRHQWAALVCRFRACISRHLLGNICPTSFHPLS